MNVIKKTNEELWEIAQEINKKELTKDEICKKHGISTRKFTDLIKPTPIRYKNNKEGYVWEGEKNISKEVTAAPKEEDKKQVNAGRPRKYTEGHTELKKLTLEIDKTVYDALMFKKITENITINKYIETLLTLNIEPMYFDAVKKLKK